MSAIDKATDKVTNKTANKTADPIVTALSKRASDLSLSIVNPKTLATKLHESLLEIAGTASIAYHIGLGFDSTSNEIKVEISHLSPHLVAKLTASKNSADLGVSYQIKTSGGWDIAVGLTASKSFHPPKGSGLVASFAVTITK